MILRPYKPCDGETIASWLTDEQTFALWGSTMYEYPMTAEQLNARFQQTLENPMELMMTAIDKFGDPLGFFMLRDCDMGAQSIHICTIVIKSDRRRRGLGREMISLAKKFCFELLGIKRITLGVFDINTRAIGFYTAVGFHPIGTEEPFVYKGTELKIIEMECLRDYE